MCRACNILVMLAVGAVLAAGCAGDGEDGGGGGEGRGDYGQAEPASSRGSAAGDADTDEVGDNTAWHNAIVDTWAAAGVTMADELDESTLADGSILDDHFSAMGGWIASTLVRLGDLKLDFLPADEEG